MRKLKWAIYNMSRIRQAATEQHSEELITELEREAFHAGLASPWTGKPDITEKLVGVTVSQWCLFRNFPVSFNAEILIIRSKESSVQYFYSSHFVDRKEGHGEVKQCRCGHTPGPLLSSQRLTESHCSSGIQLPHFPSYIAGAVSHKWRDRLYVQSVSSQPCSF